MSSFSNPCCLLPCTLLTTPFWNDPPTIHNPRTAARPSWQGPPVMHGRLHRTFSSGLALIGAPKKSGLLCDDDDDAGGSRHLQGAVVAGNMMKSEGRRLDAAVQLKLKLKLVSLTTPFTAEAHCSEHPAILPAVAQMMTRFSTFLVLFH